MSLRALVVDDEQPAREELTYLLRQGGDVTVVGEARNGIEALGLLEDLHPDVVFLDVQMPGLTGFEVARQALAKGLETELVFVTAFDEFAIDAFNVNAVDYLLKPVDPARLEQAVQRARRRIAGERGGGAPGGLKNEDVERIVKLVTERRQRRDRLAVRVGDRIVLVPSDDVIHASLADDGIMVVAGGVSGIASYRTLDELQAHLGPETFWRVHRAHVVNINKIKEIVPWFSRNYILRMKDAKSTEIPVSRSQSRKLREYLGL